MWPLSAATRPVKVIPDMFCIVSQLFFSMTKTDFKIKTVPFTDWKHQKSHSAEESKWSRLLAICKLLYCLCTANNGLLEASLWIVTSCERDAGIVFSLWVCMCLWCLDILLGLCSDHQIMLFWLQDPWPLAASVSVKKPIQSAGWIKCHC